MNQILAYAEYINYKETTIIQKIVIETGKEVGLEVNVDDTKQNVLLSSVIWNCINWTKKMEAADNFKYSDVHLTNDNRFQVEINAKIKTLNSCFTQFKSFHLQSSCLNH